jgi:hypothetical protein
VGDPVGELTDALQLLRVEELHWASPAASRASNTVGCTQTIEPC